ncbi:hypothetical protein [Nocardioides nanhaiensis]|uniref:Uncharacterized protein n=1 Tax=Nocardioides nanhaiensis TaxID=1476871 RepID=A0ABP8VSX1_9ACTN
MPPTPPSPRVPAALRVGAALTASLLLVACSGGSGELRVGGVETPAEEPSASSPEVSEPPEMPTEEPTELPTEEPTQEPTGLPTGFTQPLTPPGTELQLLENAVLPAQSSTGGRGVVSLAVSRVERPGPELDAATRDKAVYVFFDVLALEAGDQLGGWSPGVDLAGVTAEGSFLGAIAVVGGSDACPQLEVPPGWAEGDPLSGCTIVQSPPRNPMVALSYLGGGDTAFEQDPVTWAVDVP